MKDLTRYCDGHDWELHQKSIHVEEHPDIKIGGKRYSNLGVDIEWEHICTKCGMVVADAVSKGKPAADYRL